MALFTAWLSCLNSYANDLTPEKIISQMEEVTRGKSNYAEITMTIERPRYTREIGLRAWALGDDFSLVLVTSPARDEGTAFLKRKSEIWNYIPNVDRVIKLPPSMMAQSWMGSDFSNDDLVRDSSLLNDYDHKIVRTEKYNERKSWVIEMTPHSDAAIVWGRVKIWVCQNDFIQLRTENFDQNNQLAQILEFKNIRKIGGRTLPTRMVMSPQDKDQRTILEYQKLDFNIEIDESFFTQRNMQRLR